MPTYTSDSAKWQAVRSRDPLATSAFVYCVKTTRIYCRPNCSSRLARRSNVEFHENALVAQNAGYRACKRCRPELPSWDPSVEAVASACAAISAEASKGNTLSLDDLAKSSGLTKWHFHRVFKKSTGLTPKDWADRARKFAESNNSKPVSPTESPIVLDEASVDNFNELFESCSFSNGDTPWEFPLANTDLDVSKTFPMEDFVNDFDLFYDSGTATGTDSVATPASLSSSSASPIYTMSTQGSPNSSPLYYTVRDTRYGSILVGFRTGKICILKMGSSEAELMNELRSEYSNSAIDSALLGTDGTAVSEKIEEEFDEYVGKIVEALERPSGKTLDVPLNLESPILNS